MGQDENRILNSLFRKTNKKKDSQTFEHTVAHTKRQIFTVMLKVTQAGVCLTGFVH